MTLRRYALLAALALAACAEKPSAPVPEARPPEAASAPEPEAILPASTLEGYKKEVASRIARRSRHMFTEPVPDMLKSIVVLDITIDGEGRLVRVAVRRSNGFKQLEARAMESVREAAPYGAPSTVLRGRAESVNFLETFLFRDDGRFQIRSLVGT